MLSRKVFGHLQDTDDKKESISKETKKIRE